MDDWEGGVEGRTREQDSLGWGGMVSLGARIRQHLGQYSRNLRGRAMLIACDQNGLVGEINKAVW